MGRGSSGIGGGGGGTAKTPSGVSYNQFMKMSDDEKYSLMNDILDNNSIKVPDYMDGSDTSKILYALGMTEKPTVVDDATLDGMAGREIFRTVYETGSMPPPSSDAVLDQIRNGDFTQMSGKGGSYHGRAIYFATDFGDSASYGAGEQNPMVMRAKINPNANIRSEGSLQRQMYNDTTFDMSTLNNRLSGTDAMAIYALSKGIDGWYSGTYTMMVNRGVLTTSNKNKSVAKNPNKSKKRQHQDAYSWSEAADLN